VRKSIHLHQLLVSNEIGGAGLIGLRLASFFADQSRESHVWIPGAGSAQNMASQLGLTHHLYDPSDALSLPMMRAAFGNWHMWRKLYRHRPGIIHIYAPLYYRALRHAVKMSGLKSVVHIHLEQPGGGLACDFRSPPDLIMTCADFLVDHVREALPVAWRERQAIVSVPNAVDTKRFSPGDKTIAKQALGATSHAPILLMVANLAPHKGQEVAIRTLVTLRGLGIHAELWLAGIERDGHCDFTNRLRALCHDLKITPQVRFLGHRRDVPELLRAADVFLLPSTSEGLPLSILEAQASMVPVIAAPTAGIPEVVVNDVSGFLVNAHDAFGYAERIKQLLLCSETARRITTYAYKNIIENHGWSTYCDRVQNAYSTLLEHA
jgi:glycosyltransferase involved in cell wall biosynthesis